MPPISTVYLVNHTHHDVGYTDYPPVCTRQHREFVEQALDLVEATADRPEASRYRWAFEVTAPVVAYLRQASPAQVERFRHWEREGAVEVGAMAYNLTPSLTPEQMCRSLYPVRELREEFGLTITTAMQNDVNGASWLFADLLREIGVDLLTMGINQSRGRAPRPFPGGFWWEAATGERLLTWNGFHYLFGRSQAKLGDWRFAEAALRGYLDKLEAADFPYDFCYAQSTHPVRVDNGPPDPRMADFVARWNDEGHEPRLVFTTPRAFGRLLRERCDGDLEVRRGDWTDWWADGVGSSSFETGLNRGTHELAAAAEMLGGWLRAEGADGAFDPERIERIYEAMTLYDEHTWGAFSSVAAPSSLPTRAQWSAKSGLAYDAAMQTHDVLARTARAFAESRADPGPEGRFNLGDLATGDAYPEPASRELMVLNTLPWDRALLVEVPERRGGGAPVGMLEQFFPRDVPWGFPPQTDLARVRAKVPGFGYAFVDLDTALGASSGAGSDAGSDPCDLRADGAVIENAHYRVTVDPDRGTVTSWLDKELGHDFAGEQRGWRIGEYVYERVDDPRGRDALYVNDFAMDDFGYWQQDPPLSYATAERGEVSAARIEAGRAVIEVSVTGPGIRSGRCVLALETGSRVLHVDWTFDKEHVTEPESVYVVFPFALDRDGLEFRADLGGVSCRPDEDQLTGAVRDWYPVRRWADASDGGRGVTVVPLDAPLVQLGGITTGKVADRLDPEGPAIVSWAMNNHWMVNFKASQGGEIPQRYRLTTHVGSCDPGAADRFAAGVATPPIVLRDYLRRGDPTGRLLSVPQEQAVDVTLKPAADGDGLIVRLRNLGAEDVVVPVEFGIPVESARLTSVLENDGAPLTVAGNRVEVPVRGHGLANIRVRGRPSGVV